MYTVKNRTNQIFPLGDLVLEPKGYLEISDIQYKLWVEAINNMVRNGFCYVVYKESNNGSSKKKSKRK